MSAPAATDGIDLFPNLGAEEGEDWRSYRDQPAVRSAAHLWCLLFGPNTRLHTRRTPGEWQERRRDTLWPSALGSPADSPVFSWLARSAGPIAWFNTQGVADAARTVLAAELSGSLPEIVREVHDKAFAVEASIELGLAPDSLAALFEILEPDMLRSPDPLIRRLDHTLAAWPGWTERRFTLKPRFGTSGRGRVAGRDRVDSAAVRGSLRRLAERGGAIFEPWLDRVGDYSVSLLVPGPEQPDALPTVLGSLEMWSTVSGAYRGHCGEVDSRGRVFSGDREDESMRADAAAIASRARSRGYFGVCGVDSFRYREPSESSGTRVERMRGAVEFNARTTMGVVTIGLVRRALPLVRDALALTPGDRRGFALTYHDPEDRQWRGRLEASLGDDAVVLDLSTGNDPGDLRPVLVFTRDLDTLRAARRETFDC